jgi:hypothetical protein
MSRVSDIPSTVTGLDGRKVRVSDEVRRDLAHREKVGELEVYQPAGPDRALWNIWLNDRIDPWTGYRGFRITVADWIEQAAQDVA